MRWLFFYLLKIYTRNESDRLKVLSVIDINLREDYSEQTRYGNIYNYFIEFIMSNEFIKEEVYSKELDSIKIIKEGICISYDEAIKFIEEEENI